MEPSKIVIRYADGRIIKGYTHDFSPDKSSFHLCRLSDGTSDRPVEVLVNQLKAIFFVRDFSGEAIYCEEEQLNCPIAPPGRKMKVLFNDGEVLTGATMADNPHRPGFFLFPVDPKSNNIRVFVIHRAVKSLLRF